MSHGSEPQIDTDERRLFESRKHESTKTAGAARRALTADIFARTGAVPNMCTYVQYINNSTDRVQENSWATWKIFLPRATSCGDGICRGLGLEN